MAISYKSFSRDLINWYDGSKRDLPWRRTRDPYKIWVSEIMLQQTTVNTVIGFYGRFIKAFPTMKALAKAPLQTVLKQWQGLGYYNRARNLHRSAVRLMQEHRGVLPRDPEVLRAFPGFGPYTTGSVLSIAYDIPLTIIDANIRRVGMRLLALPGEANTKQDPVIKEFLLKILPLKRAGDFNQALMELGARVCASKYPSCTACPVAGYCRANRLDLQKKIPISKKKIVTDIQAVLAIIKKNDRYFIQQRPEKGLLAGLWEFPGGKIESGESESKALARELKEELGLQLRSARFLFRLKHFYTQFRVELSVFACSIKGEPTIDAAHLWVSYKDLSKYPMPSANGKIIERLTA